MNAIGSGDLRERWRQGRAVPVLDGLHHHDYRRAA